MVAVTPDGKRAFVANIGSGSVTAIDLAAGKSLGDIKTGDGAEGIDATPDGKHVWVTNRAADTVSVLDAGSLAVVASVPSTSFPIRAKVTPDGKHVLVTNARSGDLATLLSSCAENIAATPVSGEAKAMLARDTRRAIVYGCLFHGISPHPGALRRASSTAALVPSVVFFHGLLEAVDFGSMTAGCRRRPGKTRP